MTQTTTNQRPPNRWLIAGGGVLMQLALGPLLIARIREITGSYSGALTTIACVMLISSLLPLIVRGGRIEGRRVRVS